MLSIQMYCSEPFLRLRCLNKAAYRLTGTFKDTNTYAKAALCLVGLESNLLPTNDHMRLM